MSIPRPRGEISEETRANLQRIARRAEPTKPIDYSMVEGPVYEHGRIEFRCLRPDCHHPDDNWGHCDAIRAYRAFVPVALSEGFCPSHENCRLAPHPPDEHYEGYVVESVGVCGRDNVLWQAGVDLWYQDRCHQWWEWRTLDASEPRSGMFHAGVAADGSPVW